MKYIKIIPILNILISFLFFVLLINYSRLSGIISDLILNETLDQSIPHTIMRTSGISNTIFLLIIVSLISTGLICVKASLGKKYANIFSLIVPLCLSVFWLVLQGLD